MGLLEQEEKKERHFRNRVAPLSNDKVSLIGDGVNQPHT